MHHHGPQLADVLADLSLPGTSTRVVDVGCGNGDDVRWLHDAGFDAIGIDIDESCIREAMSRTQHANIMWHVGSAVLLPCPDASCVLIADRGCLHHMPTDDRLRYAAEVGRVLVPGGVWVIRDAVGHHGQVDEIDEAGVQRLAHAAGTAIESCVVEGMPGGHAWLIAVLRRVGDAPRS